METQVLREYDKSLPFPKKPYFSKDSQFFFACKVQANTIVSEVVGILMEYNQFKSINCLVFDYDSKKYIVDFQTFKNECVLFERNTHANCTLILLKSNGFVRLLVVTKN
jgi:hypothetical protein